MQVYIITSLLIFNMLEVAVLSLPFEVLQPFDVQQEECLQELNLDRFKIGLINAQSFPGENDHEYNTFFSCTWKKQGLQDQDGKINYKNLQSFFMQFLLFQMNNDTSYSELAEKMSQEAITACLGIAGSSHGQQAVRLQNCIFNKLENFRR